MLLKFIDYVVECRCFQCHKQVGYPKTVNREHGGTGYLPLVNENVKCTCDVDERIIDVIVDGTVVASFSGQLIQE